MTGQAADPMAALDDDTLVAMRAAAGEVFAAMRAANRGDSNIVWDILRFEDEIVVDQHYPDDNIRDPDSGAQYYYHCHRPGEHGHFHCFIMHDGLPGDARPVPDQHIERRDPAFTEDFCHLIAIGMDDYGIPRHLFTTNRWVTQEVVFPAETAIALLDRFVIDHSAPAWSTNRWITAMVRLFRPQIADLLRQRDAAYERLSAANPDMVVYEDTGHEILSFAEIDLEEQIIAVEAACAARGL